MPWQVGRTKMKDQREQAVSLASHSWYRVPLPKPPLVSIPGGEGLGKKASPQFQLELGFWASKWCFGVSSSCYWST